MQLTSGSIERVLMTQLSSGDFITGVDDDDLVGNDEINETYLVRDQDWDKVDAIEVFHADIWVLHLTSLGTRMPQPPQRIANPDSVWVWRWVAPPLTLVDA